jgi:hypothetical protein
MRFGTWNIRSLYKTGSLKTVVKQLQKLGLVGVKEVRWKKCGTEWAENYTLIYGEGNEDYHSGTRFFIQKRIMPVVRRC